MSVAERFISIPLEVCIPVTLPNPFTAPRHMLHGGDYNPDQWLHRPDILEADPELMIRAGVNTVSLGIFSWAAMEPNEGDFRFDWLDDVMDRLHKKEISVLLATPGAARPHWMGQKYPEVLPVNAEGVRQPCRGRHWFCRTSQVYRDKVHTINAELAQRYQSHPALLGWHINNEYGGAPGYAHCYCERCLAGFRSWLRRRYDDDLDRLNQSWWTTFWAHTYTDWSQIRPDDPTNESCLLNWYRYQSDLIVDFARHEIDAVKTFSAHPVTTNFHGHMSFFDHREMASLLDFLSFDAYPQIEGSAADRDRRRWVSYVSDMVRGFAPDRPWVLLESCPSQPQHKPLARLKRPGVHRSLSLQHVAHGADGVMYFQWRAGRGGKEKLHGAVVMHDTPADTRVFREVASLSSDLNSLKPVCGSGCPSSVAIVWDVHSEWAWQCNHGLTSEPSPRAQLPAHYEPFWTRGIGVDIVDSTADFSAYQLVIVPGVFLLRPGFADRLMAIAMKGCHVVLHPLTGWVDDDLCVLPGGRLGPELRQACGIYPEEIDFLRPDERVLLEPSEWVRGDAVKRCDLVRTDGAEVMITYQSDFYAGYPALTRKEYGQGAFWYCACGLEAQGYDRLYARLCEIAGVSGPLKTESTSLVIRERRSEETRFVFVLNLTQTPNKISVGAGWVSALTGESISDEVVVGANDVLILSQPIEGR